MRNFIFVFILAVFVLGTNGECKPLRFDLKPTCGIAADCYLNGANESYLELQSCRRKEKGLPPFLERKPGKCPKDKPPCEYIYRVVSSEKDIRTSNNINNITIDY